MWRVMVVGALLVAFVSLPVAAARAADGPTEITSQTYYLMPEVVDGQLHLKRFLSSTLSEADFPDDAVFRIPSSASQPVGAYKDYQWLGQTDDPGWVSSESESDDDDDPGLKVSTASLPADVAGPVTLTLSDVVGPGQVMVYGAWGDGTVDSHPLVGTGTQRNGTPQKSSDKLSTPKDWPRTVERFTAKGMYCFRLSLSTTLAGQSDPSTVSYDARFAVGDSTPVDAPCGSEAPPEDPGNPCEGGDGAPPTPIVLSSAHMDALYPQITTACDGTKKLALRSEFTADGVSYPANHGGYQGNGVADMDDLVIASDDGIKTTLPDPFANGGDYSFIGAPGATIFNSPQGQIPDEPWIGISTQDPTIRDLGHQKVEFRVDAVTGPAGQPAPGDVVLWDDFLPRNGKDGLAFSTKAGLPAAWAYPTNAHGHYNWSFTHSGVYCIAIAAETAMPDGHRQIDRQQLTMVVGSGIDPTTVTPCGRTQPYPTGTGEKPYRADPDTSANKLLGTNVDLTPRLVDGHLQVGLRDDGAYRSGPGVTRSIDDTILYQQAGYNAPYTVGVGGSVERNRFTTPTILWDATAVAPGQLDGDLTWTIDVDGPGTVTWTGEAGEQYAPFIDGAHADDDLWPGSQIAHSNFQVSRPGKYCLNMTWAGKLPSGQQVSDSHVVTLVVDGPLDPDGSQLNGNLPPDPIYGYDGPMFTHDADTLTKSCAHGGRATTPQEVPIPDGGGDHPTPWDVPNGSLTDSGQTILNDGHIDIASQLADGALVTKVKDTTMSADPVYRDLDKTVLELLPDAQTQVPANDQYRFLGKPGATIWQVSQTQQTGLLWPGWSTEEIPTEATQAGVTWTLTGVKGTHGAPAPGAYALYETSSFGAPIVLFNSRDGVTAADKFEIPKDTHAHGSWAFSKEGTYCLAFTRTATAANGDALRVESVLAVSVGTNDVTKVNPADCGSFDSIVSPDPIDDDNDDSGTHDNPGTHDDPGTQTNPGTPNDRGTPGTPPQDPGPGTQPQPTIKLQAPGISPRARVQTVSTERLVTVATLACPKGGGGCKFTVPKHVKVMIAGKWYTATVLAAKTLKAGKHATLRVRLSKAAVSRLKGRTAMVRIKITVSANGRKVARTVKVTVRAKAAPKTKHSKARGAHTRSV